MPGNGAGGGSRGSPGLIMWRFGLGLLDERLLLGAIGAREAILATRGFALAPERVGNMRTRRTTTAQYPDQPRQFNSLSSSTQVVSVGIGGNDKGLFLNTLITCGAEDLVFPFGTPCKNTYGHKLAEEIAEDGPVVGAALAQIHVISPAAQVFVVGYPDILPQSGNCWPTVPLTSGDVAYLNGVEQELNAMLSSEAASNGATYVDTYTPSIGRDACKSVSVRYVEPVLPESDAFSVHPNERGMAADASEVEAAMRAHGIS
ncbi:MAG: SGNH/GDSL hydrolase family protein [Solirubrobacteraceae bacterium]